MSTTYLHSERVSVQQYDAGPLCPRCDTLMVETDRTTEDGCTYIWYGCAAVDCDEQWLVKRAARMIQ